MFGIVFPAAWVTFLMLIIVTTVASLISIGIALIFFVTEEDGLFPHKALNNFTNILVNILRSIPVIIFIVIMMPISRKITGSGIGFWAGVICLLSVVPPYTTRVFEKNLKDVNKCLIEAGLSMGLSKLQILFKIIIHNAVPSIVLSIMFVAFVTLSGIAMLGPAGVIGIGNIAIVYGYKSFNTIVLCSCIVIIILYISCIYIYWVI